MTTMHQNINSEIYGPFGARQPAGWNQEEIFTSNGVEVDIADLIEGDYTSQLKWDDIPYADFYNGFWHYHGEDSGNLIVRGGSGSGTHIADDIGIDIFLGHSDLAVFPDDAIDNYMEIKNFEPSKDLLIIPFLSSDNVSISLSDNSIFAILDSGKRDRIYQLSEQPIEANVGFADQLNQENGTFSGEFGFTNLEEDAPDEEAIGDNQPPNIDNTNVDAEGELNQTDQPITSITSYYSMLGQESSSPWTNQSDQTYGVVGDGYWRYEDANDAYVAKARSTIDQSRASRGAPNSLQWEFEFGDNAVIYTMGGNDTSEETDGEDTLRVIFTGTFDYKNNDIKGRLSSITHARWGNHYRSINGVDLPLIQIEDIKTYIPSQAPIEINSFDDINQSHRDRNNGSYTTAEWDELSSVETREQFISDVPLLQNQWLQNNWYDNPLNDDTLTAPSRTNEEGRGVDNLDGITLRKPSKFKKKSADKITNFNPSTDTLEIDIDSFGIDSSVTFAAGKSKKAVKKQLAKQDFDFLYDKKKGGLYFNENGADRGFGDGGIIAILKGAPDLTSDNLEFI